MQHELEIPNQVTITSKRLLLREFTLMDAAAVFAYSTKAEAYQFADHPPHSSIHDTEEMIQRFIEWQFNQPRRHLILGIALAHAPRQLIGDIALTSTDEANKEAELGFMIDPAHWQQGYGTEAAAALVEYGLARVGWRKITATCHKDNIASARLLRRIGLQPTEQPPASKPGLRFNPHTLFFALHR